VFLLINTHNYRPLGGRKVGGTSPAVRRGSLFGYLFIIIVILVICLRSILFIIIVILVICLRSILFIIIVILVIRLRSILLVIAAFAWRGGRLLDASFGRDQTWQIVLVFVAIRREQGN
jgi:hypothetical protein